MESVALPSKPTLHVKFALLFDYKVNASFNIYGCQKCWQLLSVLKKSCQENDDDHNFGK